VFIRLLILSAVFLSIAAVGFGIRMLIKTHGRFPETHVSKNPEMIKRGIGCAQDTDTGCNSSDGLPGCACSRRLD
jgi:hypothetical protein